MMNLAQHQKGFLSILAILLVVVIGLIGAAATYQTVSDTREAANSLHSSQAFYLAQSGIEYAKHLIRNGTNACGDSFLNVALTGFPGAFSVTSSFSGTQCTLTSTGYASSASSPTGKRIMQGVLTSMGVAPAPVISGGPVTMKGNSSVTNFSVSPNSTGYAGSTIISNGPVSLSGSASTVVTGLNPSSNKDITNPDIIQNNSSVTSTNLSSQFFSASMSTIETAATQVTNENDLTSAGGTYYSNGNLTLTSNNTIGSAANPAILIVNGDLTIKGTVQFYGLLYIMGNFIISGNATVTGAVGATTSIDSSSGNATINFNTAVLNNLHTTNTNTVLHYYDTPASLQEVIS